MKTGNKALHTHTELVCYFSQIHSSLLSRSSSTTSGDFGVSAFIFQKTTPSQVTAVKNLIDNAGGHSNSEVWQQIQSVDGGWVDGKNQEAAALTLTVRNSGDFLETLRKSGQYDVDRYYEMANLTGDHKHSARFITETSYQPGMHFVQQKKYPDSRFDVHWDPRSSAFRTWDSKNYPSIGTLIPGRERERAASGFIHGNPLSSAQVRQELKRMGIVPRNEP